MEARTGGLGAKIEIVRAARDQVRKGNALIELNLSRATRKGSVSTSLIKGRPGKMWALPGRKQETWLPRV